MGNYTCSRYNVNGYSERRDIGEGRGEPRRVDPVAILRLLSFLTRVAVHLHELDCRLLYFDTRTVTKMSWLDEIITANERFCDRIDRDQLPRRGPGDRAVVTCIDPRINLAAIGIDEFEPSGRQQSQVRIIRTVGAKIDERSLLIGMFLAGIREITILAHTECGGSLAHSAIDAVTERMAEALEPRELRAFRGRVGETDDDLRRWLMTFTDPEEAVRDEIARIRSLDITPTDLILHGLVYDVSTGRVKAARET